jgi:hypothetical protein
MICISGTTFPTDDEVCNTTLTSSNQFMIGFLSDWISTYHFILGKYDDTVHFLKPRSGTGLS